MMIATSWICFCCFTKSRKEERKGKKKKGSGISTNPKAEKQPFSTGNKQTRIKASVTSETAGVGGEGARLERSDGDMACNTSQGRGEEARR